MARRKREYAFHVKAKVIFRNPSIMPFLMEGIVITDKEELAKSAVQTAIAKWIESDPETKYPINEIRVTSAKKLIKDFIIQPKDASNS